MSYKAYLTDHANGKYFHETELKEGQRSYVREITVRSDITFQTMEGFGGAATEACCHTFDGFSDEKKKEFLEDYFGNEGLRYNLVRLHINSCDFALGNYAYVTDSEDKELSTFSVAHDEKSIIPFIGKIIETSSEEIKFLASPWSPPAFMKTNGDMNHGGKLKEEYAHVWAEYIAKYIEAYRKAGVKINMITVQNEPLAVQTWDSCIYTGEEEGRFVAEHLGPVLEAHGLSDVRIFIWDHNKEIIHDRVAETFAVEGASKYISGIGFHWYTGDHFETLEYTAKKYPDKELLFTEGCVEYSRFEDSEIQMAEMYGHDMIGNINAGTCGHIDWNMLLDFKGGPNHVGNFCAAPVMATEDGKSYKKRLMYYYIGQFSRYVRSGAKRIFTSRFSDKIEATAFLNPDGSKSVVLLNRQAEDISFTLLIDGTPLEVMIPAHSMMTVCD